MLKKRDPAALMKFSATRKNFRPVAGRIDIQIEVPRVKINKLREGKNHNSEDSSKILKKVISAREIQLVELDNEAEEFLKTLENSMLSARGSIIAF